MLTEAHSTMKSLENENKELGKLPVRFGDGDQKKKIGEIIDRVQLFDNFKSPHFFPLDKVPVSISCDKLGSMMYHVHNKGTSFGRVSYIYVLVHMSRRYQREITKTRIVGMSS